MLEISHLRKSYGTKNVIPDLSLEVRDGEICGFIGHNGAGKTTTIRCAVGILPYEAGTIRINGTDIQEDPILVKKQTAYLPDNPDLYENMTGEAFLDFIADVFEVGQKEREERITSLARELEVYDVLGDSIASYSHGMKQKTALISAFLHEPKLLVLDEPFVGLDPKAAYIMKKKLRELCDRGGSVFFSSHVLEVVSNLCDQIIILNHGEIVRSGSTEEILAAGESLEEVFLETEDEK
jgi:ABC-2 type transport system ATP-binding protein